MNLLIKSTWASPTDPNESQTTVILTAITDEGETLDPDFQKFRTLDDPDTISEHIFGQWGGYANPWLAMIYLRRLLPAMMRCIWRPPTFRGSPVSKARVNQCGQYALVEAGDRQAIDVLSARRMHSAPSEIV